MMHSAIILIAGFVCSPSVNLEQHHLDAIADLVKGLSNDLSLSLFGIDIIMSPGKEPTTSPPSILVHVSFSIGAAPN